MMILILFHMIQTEASKLWALSEDAWNITFAT